jgi:hypothetical protein
LAYISPISTVTALGFGRDAMNRIQNHKEGGIASVYDRHHYAEENQRIMEAVAARLWRWSRIARIATSLRSNPWPTQRKSTMTGFADTASCV